MNQPFHVFAKTFTSRLRSRMHRQSYHHVTMETEQHRLTAAGAVAVRCVNELLAMRDEHQRSLDPSLRTRAHALLRTLPLLSLDEDPHMSTTLRALRGAAYFNGAHLPTTFHLINHMTRHAYCIDGFNMFLLMRVLAQLRHAQTSEVVQLLLPRVRQLTKELTAYETSQMLPVLARYGGSAFASDQLLQRELTRAFVEGAEDLSGQDWLCCVRALRAVHACVATETMVRVTPALVQALTEASQWYVALRLERSWSRCDASKGVLQSNSEETTTLTPTTSSEPDGAHADGSSEARRAALRAELNEWRAVMQETCACLTRLQVAPRRLLRTLLDAALVWSEHVSSSTARVELEGWEGVIGGDARNGAAEVSREPLPSLSRDTLAAVVALAGVGEERHVRSVLRLSSRIAALRPQHESAGRRECGAICNDALPAMPLVDAASVRARRWDTVCTVLHTLAKLHLTARCPGVADTAVALLEELTGDLLCKEESGVASESTAPPHCVTTLVAGNGSSDKAVVYRSWAGLFDSLARLDLMQATVNGDNYAGGLDSMTPSVSERVARARVVEQLCDKAAQRCGVPMTEKRKDDSGNGGVAAQRWCEREATTETVAQMLRGLAELHRQLGLVTHTAEETRKLCSGKDTVSRTAQNSSETTVDNTSCRTETEKVTLTYAPFTRVMSGDGSCSPTYELRRCVWLHRLVSCLLHRSSCASRLSDAAASDAAQALCVLRDTVAEREDAGRTKATRGDLDELGRAQYELRIACAQLSVILGAHVGAGGSHVDESGA